MQGMSGNIVMNMNNQFILDTIGWARLQLTKDKFSHAMIALRFDLASEKRYR